MSPKKKKTKSSTGSNTEPEAVDFSKYDEEFESLGDAVLKLEAPDISLEEAFKALEKGSQSYRQCRKILDSAKDRVEILMKEFPSDEEAWSDFTAEANSSEDEEL